MRLPVIWQIALILAFIASVSTASGADPPSLSDQPALLIWPSPAIQGSPAGEDVTHAAGACKLQPLLIFVPLDAHFKGWLPEYSAFVSNQKSKF